MAVSKEIYPWRLAKVATFCGRSDRRAVKLIINWRSMPLFNGVAWQPSRHGIASAAKCRRKCMAARGARNRGGYYTGDRSEIDNK